MTQPTLNLALLPINDPLSLIALNDRQVLGEAKWLLCGSEKNSWSSGLLSLTYLYRAVTARVRPLLGNKALAQVKGLFDNGLKPVDYGALKPVSLEEAAAMGGWIAAERIKAILMEVADDFEEVITGPSDFDPDVEGDINAIRSDLLMRLVDTIDALERHLWKHLRETHQKVSPHAEVIMVSATMGIMVASDEMDQQILINPLLGPSIREATRTANKSWVRELIEHLTDPEITASRSAPVPSISLPIKTAARNSLSSPNDENPLPGLPQIDFAID